jgi:aspartate ammonia-lyase
MNANEVIANRVLEKLGKIKENMNSVLPMIISTFQSTNDAYPTAIKMGLLQMNDTLVESLENC